GGPGSRRRREPGRAVLSGPRRVDGGRFDSGPLQDRGAPRAPPERLDGELREAGAAHLAGIGENRRMGSLRFTATLVHRGQAAAIVLDDEQVAAVGEGAKRFPVVATVDGYTWRR